MSLLFNAVQANPQQSFFAAYGSGGGGGSYPRDASFNSIVLDPSGGVFPLTLGLGNTSNIMGIRREEEGKETDYILFDPTESQMNLSNVYTINDAPYYPTLTQSINANSAGSNVPLQPARLALNSSSFTAPADGTLTMMAWANFESATSNIANGALNFEVNGSTGSSVAWFGATARTQTTSAAVCDIYPVTGGDVLTITAVASLPATGTAADGDFLAYDSRTFLQFTTL
jgi:hypothetical protein